MMIPQNLPESLYGIAISLERTMQGMVNGVGRKKTANKILFRSSWLGSERVVYIDSLGFHAQWYPERDKDDLIFTSERFNRSVTSSDWIRERSEFTILVEEVTSGSQDLGKFLGMKCPNDLNICGKYTVSRLGGFELKAPWGVVTIYRDNEDRVKVIYLNKEGEDLPFLSFGAEPVP